MSQSENLSPLLMLDKELEARGLNFVRYTSEKSANRVMTSVTKFLDMEAIEKIRNKI